MAEITSSQDQTPGMTLINWILLLILSLLWGGSFFFNGVAVKEVPVLTIVFFRVGIAALALLIFLKIKGVSFPLEKKILLAFLMMGFLNNFIPFSLIVAGQNYIGSGLASILNATTPLFAAVVAHVATKETHERLTVRRISGILFGILGVAIMMAPDIQSAGFGSDMVLGQIAILGAALSYGIAAVYGRRFGRMGISPVVSATGQVSGTTLIMLPMVLLIDKPWSFYSVVSLETVAAIIALALFSTAVAYILYFQLIKSAGATNASLVTLIIPASAILLGSSFLGEKITLEALIGMAAIGLGLLIIDGRIFMIFKGKTVST
ncbi:MAG: DMT family transporter, partial [Sneathiellales bacterium]|nr:DMT family transporter [Sneathiellales bacterium]